MGLNILKISIFAFVKLRLNLFLEPTGTKQ